MSDGGSGRHRSRSGSRIPSSWRRGAFVVVLGGLVLGNVWLLRKQYPPDDQRKNEAYDLGLRALDLDRDFARAELEFRRYLGISDEPRVRFLLALALQGQGKTEDAKREYAAVLERDAGFDQARLGLAEIADREQDYLEAFRQIDLALAEDPTPAEAHLLRGRILADVGDLDGAIAAYKKALPGSHEAYLAVAELLAFRSVLTGSQSERDTAAGNFREAESAIKARLGGGTDPRLRIALARAIAGQARLTGKRDLAEAVTLVREVSAADPADPEPTLLLARLLQESGNDTEARRAFEDAAARWPGPRTASALHSYLAAKGDSAAATKVLEDAISRDREDLSLRVHLVAFHALAGRLADADRELASAETLLADDWRVHEVRGDLERERARASAAAGDEDGSSKARAAALVAYRRALTGRPNSLRLKKKIAAQLIEGVLAKNERRAELTPEEADARRFIEEVLRVNAADSEALEWQARLLLAEGRAREAVDLLRPLAASPQPTLAALRLLGLAASRTGDDRTASEAFVRVVRVLVPEGGEGRRATPDDWCNAVRTSARAGRADLAARLAREAAAAWPESSRVAAALGAAALAQGDATGALAALEAARSRFPEDGEVRLLLAQALEAAGRIDDAAREYEAAAVGTSGDEARLRYLDFLARTGRLESAEQGFLQLLAADPMNPDVHVRLGDFYLAARPPRRDEALREYETARGLDPSAAAPLLRIADLRIADAKSDPKAYAAAEAAAQEYARLAGGDPHVDYLTGKLALVAGRPDDAIERLQRFTTARPDRGAGFFYLAAALRAAGRPEDALDPLERAARLSPGDASVRLELAALHHDLGVKAFRKGDFEAARQLFARAEGGGAGKGARLLSAGAAANLGRLDVTEAECRALLESEPGNVAARQMLATVLLRKGTKASLDEAERLYRKCLEDTPDDLFALLGVATTKFFRGLPREALEDFRRIYPRTGANPDVALAMCQCWAAAGDLRGAVDFLDSESLAHPTAWEFPHLKGDFLVNLKEYGLAIGAYLEAAARDPKNPGPPLAAASAMVAAGRTEEARKLLVERQESTTDPALFAVALGDVLAILGRTEEAQDSLRRALTLQPGHPRALHLLGRIAEAAGRTAEAKKLYREAIDHGSGDPDCHARLARILAAERDLAGAREAWLGALRWAPRDPVALNGLALVTAEDEKRLPEALGYAQSAAAIAPERAEIADTLGWILFRLGRHREAADVLVRAAALLEREPVVQFHTGMALARAGRTPEARVHLERALRLDPNFPDADTARAEIERLR